jgi:hypothetical protein
MINDAQKIVDATMHLTLRPKQHDRAQVIAAALRELINQYAYSNFNLDGDHGIDVINVKDIKKLIGHLEQ